MLLNACKDIGLAGHTGKTKYMEIRRRRGMAVNEHITVGKNSYKLCRLYINKSKFRSQGVKMLN